MAVRFNNPFIRYLNDQLKVIPGANLWFYEPGQTTTLKDTFTDASGATANTNPVIADTFGSVPDLFLDGTYGLELRLQPDVAGEKGVLIDSADPVGGDITGGSFADWNETISYSIGDLVTASDGCYYKSLADTNLNFDPASELNPSKWEKVIFIGIYNVNVTYIINNVIQASNGLLYKSNINGNLNNDPLTDSVSWSPAVSAVDASFSFFIGTG